MTGTGAQLERPVRPGHRSILLHGWLRHHFKLRDAGCPLAPTGANAVGAGIATANDNHMLAVCADLVDALGLELVAGIELVLLGQELHGEVHTVEFPARHRQVARLFGPASEQHGIKLLAQLRCADGFN